jgi:N4-gp56 family major capsid protein
MGKTYFSTTNEASKQVWDEKLFREMKAETFFDKFTSKSGDSIVHEKTELEKSQGDVVKVHLIKQLVGEGITGSSGKTLKGNEEALSITNMNISLEEYGHAVDCGGPLPNKRVFFSIDTEARTAIKEWGTNKIDILLFNALFGSAFVKNFYGGTATSLATLTAADKLTPTMLKKARIWALNGGNMTQQPLKPIKVNGKEYLVLLIHDDALFDLKDNAEYQQAMREAADRGKENPIFTGATAIYDGLVIHSHARCPIGTDAGSTATIPYSKGVLLGKQAMAMAWGQRPRVIPAEDDFERFHSYGITFMCKAQRTVFDAKDWACVGINVARTKISDA